MSLYIISIHRQNKDWVARIQTFIQKRNELILISDENKQFPTKEKLFDTVMFRFKDLNFEDNRIEINLHPVQSRFDLMKLLDQELHDSVIK